MTIEISGIARDRALASRVRQRLGAAVELLQVAPVRARAAFVDENGPKGGVDVRCALTVRLPYRPTVRVEHLAEDARAAFDGALPVLERQLARYREIDRESRRRPKKYYAARRAVASEAPATPKAPRRARRRPLA
jgi:ribosome-associated translation inhibitor RaiA